MHVCWWWQSNCLVSVILLCFCLTDIWYGSITRLNHLVLGTCRTAANLSSFHKWFSINHLEEWYVISLIFCTQYDMSLFGSLCLKNNNALGTIEISQVAKNWFKKSKFLQSHIFLRLQVRTFCSSLDTLNAIQDGIKLPLLDLSMVLRNLQIQLYLL